MVRLVPVLSLVACAPKVAPVAAAEGELAALPCPVKKVEAFAPVEWPADRAQERWGSGVTAFADVQTSVARPIEVCGVAGQVGWLLALRCPDGQPAYTSGDDAHAARVGSFGAGGRCGTIIDGYQVRCGPDEKLIYMDLYQCEVGDSPF